MANLAQTLLAEIKKYSATTIGEYLTERSFISGLLEPTYNRTERAKLASFTAAKPQIAGNQDFTKPMPLIKTGKIDYVEQRLAHMGKRFVFDEYDFRELEAINSGMGDGRVSEDDGFALMDTIIEGKIGDVFRAYADGVTYMVSQALSSSSGFVLTASDHDEPISYAPQGMQTLSAAVGFGATDNPRNVITADVINVAKQKGINVNCVMLGATGANAYLNSPMWSNSLQPNNLMDFTYTPAGTSTKVIAPNVQLIDKIGNVWILGMYEKVNPAGALVSAFEESAIVACDMNSLGKLIYTKPYLNRDILGTDVGSMLTIVEVQSPDYPEKNIDFHCEAWYLTGINSPNKVLRGTYTAPVVTGS